jgi:hypothetical protein
MATLSTLSYEIASSFDRGEDILFLERIKDLVIQSTNTFMHREADKYGVNDRYVRPYKAVLIKVNASEDVNISSRFTLLRTTNKIPCPLRYQSDVPFVFVGSLDRQIPFRYMKPYIMNSSRNLPLIGSAICYFYINEYLYVWNNTKLSEILIDAIWERLDVTKNDNDPTGLCYKDDMEFPLAGDMLNMVIQEVINIIRSTTDSQAKNPVTTRDIQ